MGNRESGVWRVIEDKRAHTPLPGRAGNLTIAVHGDGIFCFFRTDRSMASWQAESLTVDPLSGTLTVIDSGGGRTVYGLANRYRRKKVPVPPFKLTEFSGPSTRNLTFDHERQALHVVETVHEVPDPNREWNTEDALVDAVCGYSGWVQPKQMGKEAPHKAVCSTCFPVGGKHA